MMWAQIYKKNKNFHGTIHIIDNIQKFFDISNNKGVKANQPDGLSHKAIIVDLCRSSGDRLIKLYYV